MIAQGTKFMCTTYNLSNLLKNALWKSVTLSDDIVTGALTILTQHE